MPFSLVYQLPPLFNYNIFKTQPLLLSLTLSARPSSPLSDLHWLSVAILSSLKFFCLLLKLCKVWLPTIFAICSFLIIHHIHPMILAFSSSLGIVSLPWGGRLFSVVAPKLRNSLPRSLAAQSSLFFRMLPFEFCLFCFMLSNLYITLHNRTPSVYIINTPSVYIIHTQC